MVALRPLHFGGALYAAGETFEADAESASIALDAGRAELAQAGDAAHLRDAMTSLLVRRAGPLRAVPAGGEREPSSARPYAAALLRPR